MYMIGDKMKPVKIKTQMTIITAITIVVCLLLNIWIGGSISKTVLNKSISHANLTADILVKEMEYTSERALAVVNTIQYNSMTQDYFKDGLSGDNYHLFKAMDNFIVSINLLYPEIIDVVLVGQDFSRGNVILEGDQRSIIEEYSELNQMKFAGIIETTYSGVKIKTMTFFSNIYGNEEGPTYAKSIGHCLIAVNFSKLTKSFKNSLLDTNYFVVDKNNNYFPISQTEKGIEKIIDHLGPFTAEEKIDTANYYIDIRKVKNQDLFVISSTDKKLLLKDVNYVKRLILLLCVIISFVMIVMIFAMDLNIMRPIYQIRNYMRTISSGNYILIKEKIKVKGNRESVGLADDLNSMIDELDDRSRRLVGTSRMVYEMEIQKEKAELSFLRSQINPHFLYNSLEAIRGTAMKNNLPQVADVASNLGKVFRYSIKGSEIVTFQEEIEITKSYTSIQKARFPYKVDIIYNISTETLDVKVIKMFMQPILENAFVHVVEKSVVSTTIYVAAIKVDNDLIVTVQDDGCGIAQDKLESINKTLNNNDIFSINHIGLANVNSRIRMKYGEGYGLSIESSSDEGTKITIRLALDQPQNQKGGAI